jgi:hypothetical protein
MTTTMTATLHAPAVAQPRTLRRSTAVRCKAAVSCSSTSTSSTATNTASSRSRPLRQRRGYNTRSRGGRGRSDTAVTTAALPPDTAAAAIAEVASLFDNPLEKFLGGGQSDGDLPAWFPFASFVAYLWVGNGTKGGGKRRTSTPQHTPPTHHLHPTIVPTSPSSPTTSCFQRAHSHWSSQTFYTPVSMSFLSSVAAPQPLTT